MSKDKETRLQMHSVALGSPLCTYTFFLRGTPFSSRWLYWTDPKMTHSSSLLPGLRPLPWFQEFRSIVSALLCLTERHIRKSSQYKVSVKLKLKAEREKREKEREERRERRKLVALGYVLNCCLGKDDILIFSPRLHIMDKVAHSHHYYST
ncbi:uncharacterized protein AAG666_023641 isoform 1-T2 [Megaptera novaeangliae]